MFVKVRFDLPFLVTGVELEILGTVGIKFTTNFDKQYLHKYEMYLKNAY